jgi:hypothetical protein
MTVIDIIAEIDWTEFAPHGFDVTAVLVPDTDSHADEDWRSMDADTAAAYGRGDWQYVGVIVSVSVSVSRAEVHSGDGLVLGSDSIWGSQYGSIPGVDGFVNPLTDTDYPYRADLIDNAIADARMTLAELAARS